MKTVHKTPARIPTLYFQTFTTIPLTSGLIACCAALGLMTATAPLARADVVIVQAVTGASQSVPTACPPYCELAGNWAGSTLKSSAAGLVSSRGGSRFQTQTAGSVSVAPTLGANQGAYYVEVTHGSATSISADVLMGITVTGGSGLPATTDGFQQTKGVNAWYRIGTLVLDGTTYSPTITFTYASGAASRTYADGFRFINTNTVCITGLPQLTMVNGPLAAGQTFVNVPAVDGTATNVSVYAYSGGNYSFLGSRTSGIVAGLNTVTTTPLVKGQVIVATQWKGGVESCLPSTGPFVGGGPNPQIRLSLSIRDSAPTNHTIGADGGTAGTHLVFVKADGTVGGGFGVAPTGGLALSPGTCWQRISFNRASDSLFGWSGAYGDSYLTNDFAVLDAIAFCVQDTADSGPFAIYIDNFMNGTNVVQDFESATNGEATVLINQPSFAGSTSPYLLAPTPGTISPNVSVVVNTNVASGNNCLFMSWQFKDDSNQDWLRATFQGTRTPNPIIDLRQPVSFDVLLLPVGQNQGHFVNASAMTNATVFMTQTATFGVTTTGPGTFAYQWNVNGTDIPGATKNTYSVTNVQPGDAGSYFVTVNDGTCATVRSANLTVLYPVPTVTLQPVSTNVYLTQNATFTVAASGNVPTGNPVGYQWRFYGVEIQNATNTTLTITNASALDVGPYDVVITNFYGLTNSAVATLTVLDPIPTVTNQPVSQVVNVTGNAQFKVGADGHVALGYPLSYQWRFNGTDITDQTTSALSITSAQVADVGSYDVVAANIYGSVTSVVATLSVLPTGVALGNGTGLHGAYYNNPTYTNDAPPNPFSGSPALVRVDPTLNFDWLAGSPSAAISNDYFSVRWSGQLQPLGAGDYTFYTTTDDGLRLYLGGQLVIDHWILQAPTEWSNTVSLAASKTDLVLEYYEKTGGAVAKLSWSSPNIAKQIVSMSQLYPVISSPSLSYQSSRSNMVFTWSSPYSSLQTATNLFGPWTILGGATSPYTNPIGTELQRYFRLAIP